MQRSARFHTHLVFGACCLAISVSTAPSVTSANNCTAQLRALGECGGSNTRKSTAKAGNSRAEKQLTKQARAMQRTIAEGVAIGAAIGTAVDIGNNNKNNSGLTIGITAGALAGSYVARLQRKYARKERQLEKVRDDINRANAELEAAIGTMRAVLDLQATELAKLRARSGSNRKLRREVAQAQANLSNMRAAIKGAQGWEKEFKSTRSLKLVRGQLTGVDREIAALGQRIENMRRIADTLNGVIKS